MKRGKGFASVSEACTQVMQAVTELSENDSFRDWAQQELFNKTGVAGNVKDRRSIVFAVALVTKQPGRLHESMTPRAMEALVAFKEHLEHRNYIPAFMGIEDKN